MSKFKWIVFLFSLSFVYAGDTLWVDVRTIEEVKRGSLKGAIHIPLQILDEEIEKQIPDRNKVIALYCAKGVRAEKALKILLNKKYRFAYNAGGYEELRKNRK